MNTTKPFAEVIESSLTGWSAQSWKWNAFPHFGSLVIIEAKTRTIFGIIHQVQTGSMDPSRYPFAYQKSEEELLAEQPQIFEFLKTTFSCLVVGYRQKGKLVYQLAPEPPQIHAFVQTACPDLAKEFFYSHAYLPILFGMNTQLFNIDELLLAIIRQLIEYRIFKTEKLYSFLDAFCLFTGNDYRRLKIFLQRVETFLDHISEE